MATSGSLGKRKEKKPESVHFWLAITAGSLLFHSLFMFGVSRSVKVSVVEPAVSGAIDVEFVDPLGSEVVAGGDPIVPASALKPQPTPLPEFTPEPSPEPSLKSTPEPPPKSIVKPEVQEKKPIVQPEKKENPNLPVKVTTPKKNSTETPPLTSPKKLTEPSEITGVRSVTVQDSFDPEPQSSNGDMPSKDDPPSKLKLNPHPALSIPKNSTLFPVGKSATIDVQFAATCPVSTGTVCDATQVKLRRTKFAVSYSGPASTQSPKDLEDIDKLATDILSKASVQSLTIETSANGKPDTFWSITFTLR